MTTMMTLQVCAPLVQVASQHHQLAPQVPDVVHV
jgi:hypothetical protein